MSRRLIEQYHEFLSDPNLALAIESIKRVDDVFDIISPSENQHSCILQWLFDPREGHGQGEAIFKDFLNAVFDVGAKSGRQQVLFETWTPARIAITGFQSLIVIREKSMMGKGRQDLLLVDPVHKFVILVENKAGSSWTPTQLKEYRTDLQKLTKSKKAYEGYTAAFVLLDRFKDDESMNDGEIANWAYIDYSWLEKAARRAEARASRSGDLGHQLVISYCRRQAQYESADERNLDDILAGLNQAHREVVQAIAAARREKRPEPKHLTLIDIDSLIWVWAHQNKDLARMLEGQKPLAFLKSALAKTFGDSLQYDVRKKTMYVIDKTWDALWDKETSLYWPITIKVRDTSDDGVLPGDRKYSVVIEFWPGYAKEHLVVGMRAALAKLYGKEAQKFAEANVRRIGRVGDIEEKKLHSAVNTILTPLQRELQILLA